MIAAALLWVYACSPEKEAIRKIDKPLPDISLGQKTFIIDTSKDTLLELKSGSKIFVPANSIVDAKKNPVSEANILYEEYLDQASILLSGIPMAYDSAMEENVFTSAGMFWINATKASGEQLFISDNSEIRVDMASNITDELGPYNFYQFDTIAGNWNYITTKKAVEAEEDNDSTAEINANANGNVNIQKNTGFVFEMEFTDSYDDVESFDNILWKYSGNKEYLDPEIENWIFNAQWATSSIRKDSLRDGEYILVLTNQKKSFITSIVPVKGQDIDETAFNEKIEAIEEGMVEIEKSKSRANDEGKLVRSMGVNGFGFYNWDCIHQFKTIIRAPLAFMNEGVELNASYRVYQIFFSINGVLEYNSFNKNKVLVTSDEEYIFVALNKEGEVLLSENTYDLYIKVQNGLESINMYNTNKKITSSEDLMDIIL